MLSFITVRRDRWIDDKGDSDIDLVGFIIVDGNLNGIVHVVKIIKVIHVIQLGR